MGEEDRSVALIASAIRKGHIRVFTAGLFKNEEDWALDHLSASEAEALGYAFPEVRGPTNSSYALTPLFWEFSRNFDGDLELWDWSSGEFVVGRCDLEAVKDPPFYWEVRKATFNTLEIEALIRLHQLLMLDNPKPIVSGPGDTGGRPRTRMWDDWTAEAVFYFDEVGLDPDADVDQIAIDIDNRLKDRGAAKVDATAAKRIIQATLDYARFKLIKPRKT